jgi:hypothetical protein
MGRRRISGAAKKNISRAQGASSEQISAGDSVRFDNGGGEITSPRDLLKLLQRLFRLGEMLEIAYQRQDVDACVKLARELCATAGSYARSARSLVEGGGNTTLIDARRQQIAVLGQLSLEESERLLLALDVESEQRRALSCISGIYRIVPWIPVRRDHRGRVEPLEVGVVDVRYAQKVEDNRG